MADEKILANETLKDSDLEQVAGGTTGETYNDMQYLRQSYGVDFSGGNSTEKLKKVFANVGIGFIAHDNGENEYYDMLTGKHVGRGIALDEAGRHYREQKYSVLDY